MEKSNIISTVFISKISRRGGVEDDRKDTPNRSYRKQPLLLKSHHLMFTRAQTRTSLSLPSYFLSDPVDNAFATNVRHSAGHLTSFCNTISAHLQQQLLSGESKARIGRLSKTQVDLPKQTLKVTL
jgi:hypothetical protein